MCSSVSSAYCIAFSPPGVRRPFVTTYWTPFTQFTPAPHCFPSGKNHSVVCVYELFFICFCQTGLFNYLLISWQTGLPYQMKTNELTNFTKLDTSLWLSFPSVSADDYSVFSRGAIKGKLYISTKSAFSSLLAWEYHRT